VEFDGLEQRRSYRSFSMTKWQFSHIETQNLVKNGCQYATFTM